MGRKGSTLDPTLIVIGIGIVGIYYFFKWIYDLFVTYPWIISIIIILLIGLFFLIVIPKFIKDLRKERESSKWKVQYYKDRQLRKNNIPFANYFIEEFDLNKYIKMDQVGIIGDVEYSNTIPVTIIDYYGTKEISFGFERGIDTNFIVFTSPSSHISLNANVRISFLFDNGQKISYKFDKKPESFVDSYDRRSKINTHEIFIEHLNLFSQQFIQQIQIQNALGQVVYVLNFPLKDQKWEKIHEVIQVMGKEFIKIVNQEITNNQFKNVDDIDKYFEYERKTIQQSVKDRVWNRDGGQCVQCGSKVNLEFDHIIPVSKGGANTYRNIQLLCEKCNRSKSNKIG